MAMVLLNLIRGEKVCGSCRELKPLAQFSMRTELHGHKKTLGYVFECKECSKKRSKAWYYANTERALAQNPINILRLQVIEKFGGRCANPDCLVPGGCTDPRALQLDHVNNDGAAERRKINDTVGPKGGQGTGQGFRRVTEIRTAALEDTEGRYQLLCANCNVIKEYERKQEKMRARRADQEGVQRAS
jgi:hypothetical protein